MSATTAALAAIAALERLRQVDLGELPDETLIDLRNACATFVAAAPIQSRAPPGKRSEPGHRQTKQSLNQGEVTCGASKP